MKKVLFLTICLLLGIGVGICDAKGKNRKPDSEMMQLVREISLDRNNYTALSVDNGIQVILEIDRDPRHIRIETENTSAEWVTVQLRQNTLELSFAPKSSHKRRKNNFDREEVTVYVGVGTLDSFHCSGHSSIYYDGDIDRPVVWAEASGVSRLEFGIRSKSLFMDLTSSSSYRGTCRGSVSAQVNMQGVSKFDGSLYCRRKMELHMSGSSDFRGNITCHGEGKIICDGASELKSRTNCQDWDLQLNGASLFEGDIICGESIKVNLAGVSELFADVDCDKVVANLCSSSSWCGSVYSTTLDLSMAGCSKMDSSISSYKVNMDVESSSEFTGIIDDCDTMNVSMSGVSECRTSGGVENLVLELSGSSNFIGKMLEARESAQCSLTGISEAEFICLGDLKYKVERSSTLTYRGTPHILSATVNGGTVRAR